jgi:pyruvate formate lyase activating enzyme
MVRRNLEGKSFTSNRTVGSWLLPEDVLKEIDKDAVFYEESEGGVTFSGGEPLMQPQALAELLELCREKGYHTAVDTSGHAEPAALKQVIDLADLWLFDLKIMDDARHVEYTGVSNELALQNLRTLTDARKEIIVRFPLVPGITDDRANMDQVVKVMAKLNLDRIDILPYHSIAREKYLRMGMEFLLEGLEEPGEDKVSQVMDHFKSKGFSVNTGNR